MKVTLIWGSFLLAELASHSLMIFPQTVQRSSSALLSSLSGKLLPEVTEI